MSDNKENDQRLAQQGVVVNGNDDLSSKLSYDDTTASKFDSSIDDISHLPPDNGSNDDDDDDHHHHDQGHTSKMMGTDDYNDDVFAMHSIPHPDELPRAKHVKTGRSKAMQTFAGVAGNVLEWCVYV